MVVEVFVKGSNFKKLKVVYWGVKSILYDGLNITLIFYPEARRNNDNVIVLDGNEYEIRVCS